ncbi:MAG: hypothetical protein CM15mP100_2560 [Alphaproteobacteria bacterium]|nr:MAG: hypothetical protein CM15mP100_2560 [Alphaproteobacteria bacterium]
MKAVHGAAQRNPVLAACLLARLADMRQDRLLSLCGDEVMAGGGRPGLKVLWLCCCEYGLFGSLMTQLICR